MLHPVLKVRGIVRYIQGPLDEMRHLPELSIRERTQKPKSESCAAHKNAASGASGRAQKRRSAIFLASLNFMWPLARRRAALRGFGD
jgi:hypothetical protein